MVTTMEVIADLHIHSHFSIATGREADLPHLDLWGRYKGLDVVGTGDCTHPGWLSDLAAKLSPTAGGLYALKPGLALPLDLAGPRWDAAAPIQFAITGEVSTIYKKGGKVRKVHLLLVLSSLEAARKLSQRLGRLGNVASDGRPILGLDARFVLELVLEIDPQALVIPAHIWTPWFSVLGSKSGFDSLEECFEDATAHIVAVETGLSSDPPMNWRVSDLDRFTLVSNSDAHSPQKLAREANIFHVPAAYAELSRALRTQEGFGGTLEFFPQEGKYHLDGHRNCGLRLDPEEAQRLGGLCPHCGKALTLGVMHRVQDLADRAEGARPAAAPPFESLIALPVVLAEVLGVGAGSKKVRQSYFRLLEKLGPELEILRRAPLTAVAREGGILLAHGIDRMRRGEVHIAGGYDGAFGEIHLFTPAERSSLLGQPAFFSAPADLAPPPPEAVAVSPAAARVMESPPPRPAPVDCGDPLLAELNADQRQAVVHQGPALIVQAGPGTGKTRALTHRLAYLVRRRGVDPGAILALTFTRQAAAEMEGRTQTLLAGTPGLARLTIKTFHALGQQILQDQGDPGRGVADEEQRRGFVKDAAKALDLPFSQVERRITGWKQALLYPEDLSGPLGEDDSPYAAAFAAYEAALHRENLWDYEDLIARPALLLARAPEVRDAYRTRFRHLLVDEYQDLNEAQYHLFRQLAGPGGEIMVIGDPDQAIYGFRGARPEYFRRFLDDWPEAALCRFHETYRLPEPILKAATSLRNGAGAAGDLVTHQPGDRPVVLLTAATPGAEARAIARQIEQLVGGLSHYGLEDAQVRHQAPGDKAGFRDVAVLYRLHALGPELERALAEAGIPCQQAREGVGPDWDGLDLAAERVKLLTLHAAKGLEFPYVFIAGCETGLLPWEPEGDGAADPDEERRLFYVGLTRASRQVFLSRARERSLWGRKRRTQFPAWVGAMDPEVLERQTPPESRSRRARQPRLFPELSDPRGKRSR
ncbi:MAG: UvrD-helicase domain-containing protein [Syntrophobacterales bacterium]|jgi:DNA helicase-2/ATP-dependent DNA helicase PcrA|nr:UvrD-helicase domain-containing protein [Syntrophobacterales bacterium]